MMSLADIGSLALLLLLIQYYTQPGSLPFALPSFISKEGSLYPILIFLFIFIAKNYCGYLLASSQYHFVYGIATRLSRQGMLKYLNGPYTDYAGTDASVYIRNISHQPIEFSHYVLGGMMQVITEAAITLIAIIAILLFNAKLFLILLLVLLPPVLISAYLTRKKLKMARTQVQHTSEKTTQYLQEALNSYIESNIYDKRSFFSDRYTSFQQKLNQHLSQLQLVQAMPSRLMEVFAIAGLFLLILVNQYTAAAATTELINIGAFMAAAYKIIPGITRMSSLSAQMRMYAYSIKDSQPGKEKPIPHFNAIKEPIKSVVFEKVSFAHTGKEILNDFSCSLQQGDFIGLSSASGKGKTTLINLLLGFLEPQEGQILMNGLPVNAEARQQYWYDIAYVKQQQFLIHDSIARNICLNEDAYDAEKLQQAIAFSGLEAFVNSFPEGQDKIIADSGKNISGGQRQRIAIARALYKDAGLIILDEPFNELDSTSEASLLRHFKMLIEKGKIVILVTHNSNSLSFCNKIITLNE